VVIFDTKKMSKKGPLVFLDVSIDGDPAERMVFEVLPCYQTIYCIIKFNIFSHAIELNFCLS